MQASSADVADRRLRWRCRRGMLELDTLLLAFVDRGYAQLPQEMRAVFEHLLSEPDQQLLEWLMGREVPHDKEVVDVIERIRRAVAP